MSYASDTDKGESFSALYGHTGHRLDALDMVPGYTLDIIEYMRHLYSNILTKHIREHIIDMERTHREYDEQINEKTKRTARTRL